MRTLTAIILSLFLVLPAIAEDTEPTAWEKSQQEQALQLEQARFDFEREKWNHERSEEKRKEYEEQFPGCFDLKRVIPTYEFVGYVSDTNRRELQKIFTIMLEEGKKEMKINISSFGGSAFDGMGVADAIENAKTKGMVVYGHAFGKIASAAVPIFAACSERTTGPSTLFMVHEASLFKFFSSESKSDLDSQTEMLNQLENRYVDMLVRNSKMSSDHWKKAIKKETWFSASTAMEWGIVDKIE